MSEPDLDLEGVAAGELVEEAENACAEGDYALGALLAENGVRACERDEEGPLLQARALRAWAVARHGQNDDEPAAELADRALALLAESPEGESARFLAAALHTRAEVYLAGGGIEAAVPLLARAAELLRPSERGPSGEYAAVALTLADVSAALGEHEAAADAYGRVVDLLGAAEPDSPEHAAWLNGLLGQAFFGLGACHLSKGALDQGKDYLGRALEFFEAARGRGHPEVFAMLRTAAHLYRQAGDEAAALAAEAELEAHARPSGEG